MEMLIKMYQLFNNHFNVPCHRRCSSTLLSETETKEKSKTKHFRRATWKIRSLQQLRPKRLQYLINSWQNPTKLSVTWALPGRRDDPWKSQFPEVSLHLVCAPAWQASLMWGQRLKKPQKTSLWTILCFPASGLPGTSHGWSTTMLRFQLLIDDGAASVSSWMSQQHLDSRKTQHLPSSQQRALLLIKQPCLLKALCVLTQQCLSPQHSKPSRLEKFTSSRHWCSLWKYQTHTD